MLSLGWDSHLFLPLDICAPGFEPFGLKLRLKPLEPLPPIGSYSGLKWKYNTSIPGPPVCRWPSMELLSLHNYIVHRSHSCNKCLSTPLFPLSLYIYIYIHTHTHTYIHMGFPSSFLSSSADKESACNAGDPGSIPGSGRHPREGIGYPLQYSWVSLVAKMVKNPPAMQETWV